MNLAFSTIGCPDWSLEKIVSKAVEYGFKGVEFRGLENELYLPNCKEFSEASKAGLQKTKKLFKENKLDIVCISSSVRLSENEEQSKKELIDYSILANKLGIKNIRIFSGDMTKGQKEQEFLKEIGSNMKKLADLTKPYKVNLLLETHGDDLSSAKKTAEVLKNAGDCGNTGVVWDIGHTVFSGEKVEESYRFLKDYLKHTHIKDEIITENKEEKSVLVGKGKVPVKAVVRILNENNYRGYLCLEWEKLWQKNIEEPEIAFPQYIDKIKEYLK